jgi:hypothetical protein
VRAQTRRNIRQQAFESFLRHADRAGIAHVPAGRLNLAFGHERNNRRNEGVAELIAIFKCVRPESRSAETNLGCLAW